MKAYGGRRYDSMHIHALTLVPVGGDIGKRETGPGTHRQEAG